MTTTRTTAESEALQADLDQTRQRLADTVEELSRRLNVPRRLKESAAGAAQRAVRAAGQAGHQARRAAGDVGYRAVTATAGAREGARQVPELSRRHPRAMAAVAGAVALGVGAALWVAGRGR
ncbi:MAG TPA: DUF3618 domain-containing protein [Kribbella sp.]|nr:DUF3618 domain-containing protein [Kribbella sp.]